MLIVVFSVGWSPDAAAQPAITLVSPASVTYAITPDSSVTISGSGFVSGATITVGTLSGPTQPGTVASAAVPFVFVNANTLRFFWDNIALNAGTYDVTVTNPASAGQDTLANGFQVLAPQPTITGSAPTPVTYGITPSSSITVSGSAFVVGATLTVGTPTGGTCALPGCLSGTTVAGATATAAVPFVFTSSGAVRFYWANTGLGVGSYPITVTNPASAGGLAATLPATDPAAFVVSAPQPTITGSAPTPVTYGITPSSSITVSGSAFVVGATITVGTPTGGTCALPGCLSGTTVAGATATAAVPFVFSSSGAVRFYWANTALGVGSYPITVTNPASAGSGTATLANAFVVSSAQPTIAGSAPTPVIYGITPSSSITVSGSAFVVGATITVGTPTGGTCALPGCLSGTTVAGATATAAVPFVFTSSGAVRFYWPNTSLAPNSYPITVTNPASAGGASATLPATDPAAFVVSAPQPIIGATAPNPVTYDTTPSRAIIITGSGFIVGATVTIGTPEGGPCPPPPRSSCLTGTTVSGTTATAAAPFVHVTSNQLSFYWANTSLAPGPPPSQRRYDVTVTNPATAGSGSDTLAGGFQVMGPVPVITGVTPSSVEYNQTDSTSVRITGTNFYQPPAGNPSSDPSFVTVGPLGPISCVLGAGPATATTPCVHISRTAVDFYWPNTSLPPGQYTVRVTNPTYAGSASGELVDGFNVTAPQPEILSIRPVAVTAGITPSRAVDIVGVDDAAQHIGFVVGAQVRVEGVGLPTTQNLVCTAVDTAGTTPTASNRCVYIGPGLLRFYWDTDEAAATANPVLGPGTYNITVTNPVARGGLTDQLSGGFRVTALPELISVAPTAGVGSGAQSAVITLTTAGFAAGSVIRIGTAEDDPLNGSNPPYVQTQDAQVTMRSAFRAFASGDGGTVVIDVAEDPAQTATRQLAVTITSADGLYRFTCPDPVSTATCKSGLAITPSPVVTTITPALGVGASGRTLTIVGQRFVASGTTVTLPTGVSGTCTAASAAAINCTNVTVAATVSPGSLSVVVTNPDGGRTTGTVTINAPPVIASILPGAGAAGATVPVQITGSGFQSGITLTFDSGITPGSVTVVNASTVSASLVVAAGAADGYRSLAVTNPDGGAAIAPQAFYIGVLPTDTAQALATFGQQGQSLVRYQRSFGAGWSSGFAGPALASPPVWQVMKANPVRNERVLAVRDDQRRLTLHVWNGQAWIGSVQAAGGSGLGRPTQTVDVAYEQQSGRGVAVYATADTTLRYRVWDGSAWSAEGLVDDALNGPPTSGRPLWVRLEARPGTDDVILAYADSNDDVAAFVWSGGTQQWGDAVLLTSSGAGHDASIVDVAFERLTGRAVVAWATTESPAGRPRYRLWNSGWGEENTASLGATDDASPLAAVRMVGDHASNRIALVTSDGSVLVGQLWDGQQWAGGTTLTAEVAGEGEGRAFDAAWEGVSGDLLAVYSTRSAAGGTWRTWSSSGGWSAPTNLAAAASETVLTSSLFRAVTSAEATVVLVGAPSFPDSGTALIEAEVVSYTSKSTTTSGGTTTTTLAGLTRGALGTTAAAHASGAAIRVVPYPAWVELAAARGINDAAMTSFDTQGRVTLRRWTGSSWTATLEAQASGAGLVAVFDPSLGRTVLVGGRTAAVTLAQHLAGPGPGISPPPVIVDTTSPAVPTLNAGSPSATSVPLSWNAVGDDGAGGGMVARYELRRSSNGSSAVQNVAPTQAPGGTENLTAGNLFGGTTYTFELRALDEAGNASAWSTSVTVTTAVDQPPPAVVLSPASAATTSTAPVRWGVPSDDSGPIAGYQVRYTTSATFDFDLAIPYTLHPPTVVGSTATLTIDGLAPNTTYRIGVKAVDAVGQVGALSNVLSVTTAIGASSDVTPPSAVTDLVVFGGATTNNALLLQWTATGDDGTVGTASAYEIRYASFPLIAANFSQGILLGAIPPGASGTAQELSVNGLAANTTYYVALRVRDDSGNVSPLSNVATARTALRRGYTIVSVPLVLTTPNDTPDLAFGDDVGLPPYVYHWLSSGSTAADGCYAGTVSQLAFPTCAALSSIETGAAYYLYSAGTRAVLDATGSPVTIASFEVALDQGFNMVGNPYGEEIALSAVRVRRASDPLNEVSFAAAVVQGWVAGAMYVYDGAVHQAYAPTDPGAIFRPWNGAWIQSRMADVILIFDAP